VSRSAAEPWRDRLLALPSFLTGSGKAGLGDIIDGLTLSGYFLERHVYQPQGLRLPDSRERLLEAMRRKFREGPAKLDD
jgi:DNA repair protein RecO (recombination protein O)